jgi:hypothetical protein
MVCDSTSSKTGRFIEVRDNYNEIISILEHADNNSLVMALQHLVSSKLTNNGHQYNIREKGISRDLRKNAH